MEEDEDDFFKSLAPSKLPRFVELLKFKAVTPGMKLLGVVTEVRATELAVSLPHGLVGRYVWHLVFDVWRPVCPVCPVIMSSCRLFRRAATRLRKRCLLCLMRETFAGSCWRMCPG